MPGDDEQQLRQTARKRIEEVFGRVKTLGLLRKVRHRGLERVGGMFTFTAAAYNMVLIRNLRQGAPQPTECSSNLNPLVSAVC
jgi:hypothetical protein